MSLERALKFVALATARDWHQADLLAEDVVYRPIAEMAEAGEYRGRDAYRAYMEAFLEGEWSTDLEFGEPTVREYGNAVIVRYEMTGHGRASGLELGIRVFQVLTFTDDLIVRIEDFVERDAALKAADVTP